MSVGEVFFLPKATGACLWLYVCMPHHLLSEALLLALASFLAVALVLRFRFSPIIGYLGAGLLIGPHGFNLLPATEGIRLLGEVGVAILMFVVGLEFSLPRMLAAKRAVFGFGSLQVGATALLAMPLGIWAGAGLLPSLLVGFALAMSSTAIVHKQLVDEDEATSHYGALATGFLLFQDFAALPLLAIVTALHGGGEGTLYSLLRIGLSVSLFILVAAFAKPTLGQVLAWTARSHSNELFLLATVLLVLGGAVAADQLHLSLPIGAFIIGMVIGESDFRHQLEEEIRPFRDLLLGLFFLTVGMTIDWRIVVDEPGTTFTAFGLLLAIKLVVVFLVLRWGGVDNEAATRTALLLAHGGEFALLLISQTLANGVVPASLGQPALAAVALSMLIAPAIAQWNGRIAAALWKERGHSQSDRAEEAWVEEQAGKLKDHVILAGCGSIGRLVATVLEACGVGYVAIERDPGRLRRAQAQGHNVVFGDATRPGILRAAGIKKASAVISLLGSQSRVERLLREIRMMEPDLPVIVSTRDDLGLAPLVRAGATHIFPENLAAGLALATQTLIALGMPVRDAVERIRTLRIEFNPELAALTAPPPA